MLRGKALGLLLATVLLSGCDALTGSHACSLVQPLPPINVDIRDANGRAQALGATVTFADGAANPADTSVYDSLRVSGGDYNARYDIYVYKPYYNTAVVRDVHAPREAECSGSHGPPVTVQAVLSLSPGAPPVRSVHFLPDNDRLDRGRNVSIAVIVDASPGVSQAVHWRMSGLTAGVSIDSLTNTLVYRCQIYTGPVTVVALSAVDSTKSASADFTVQGHPATTSDTPCP